MFRKKVLIANRGEIARRVIRTCKQQGYGTVAIYSAADQDMPYVEEADEAVHIGPAPVAQSYLQMDKIIDVAKDLGVAMIHPGYGLLSENAEFARKCQEAGITFIGPSPEVIRQMGDKLVARQIMKQAGVPVVPGGETEAQDVEQALAQAEAIGYPVMLKASAGGGGIGLSVCHHPGELEKAYASAKGRAKAYFGQDHMFVEKYIEDPRHIEVQIVADQHGHICHLFERDCSIQRRHQKVIEESPSPFVDEQTRAKICQTAVKAAQAVGYTGVGTVEFIMGHDKAFYFIEMNTRLQVEHPVTEAITGYDLVALQLAIAENQPLPFAQEEVKREGHAIELRIYAEDPVTFMPSPGQITLYERQEGDGVRFDDAIRTGSRITPYYDPLIAKLIVSDSTRTAAIEKGIRVLNEMKLEGIKHNIPFLLDVLNHEQFRAGNYTTQFVKHLREVAR
ncbi:Carbamoyl-phosphate synthase L chain ATP-binding [Caldalkalibacillus thermarum TA2.A1]|uniref:biotin carboxylase n=1 Tax=Caldalkalibacillus thermarum (strain TA2.A1) TaxID=986075 RepID=F5L8Y4_CALTT|nr:acetyl-CoA carboxylase biotin carboxylase subunit [Caldalkalibacillus thermarum]EGL82158.1 Carbamoyl-phosphate synthase L chain ATP-binding [Caldalkalibacillus thermarum TA2.A1]QZT33128.1 acetyl-CoA carboxylase biotin carboxylase subunit [Caldalkalibacillus thermarum TA2.A1]